MNGRTTSLFYKQFTWHNEQPEQCCSTRVRQCNRVHFRTRTRIRRTLIPRTIMAYDDVNLLRLVMRQYYMLKKYFSGRRLVYIFLTRYLLGVPTVSVSVLRSSTVGTVRLCQSYTKWHWSHWLYLQLNQEAVTKRPCNCCAGQFWPNVTGRRYFTDIIGLFSATLT